VRVIYFGMPGEFSRAPLTALLQAAIDVRGVVIPATRAGARSAPIARAAPAPGRSELPIVDPYLERSIAHLAWERGLPVFEVSRPAHPDTLAALADLQADVACVACFPQRIPASLLALPRFGFLNLHPSLLPAFRGPEPLFWTFRSGERTTGVTIHFMDEGLDTGDIAAQASLDLADGVSGAEANQALSTLGGRVMLEAVQTLERETLTRRPQPAGGSYYPSPAAEDFALDTTWPARRAFNFMRGTAEWNRLYPVEAPGGRLILKSAVSFSASGRLGGPAARMGDMALIQFNPGVLQARIA
jgi:methionyl-tRNA formyltransferase